MSAPPGFTYEVMSKVETLQLDGGMMYMLQGKLRWDYNTNPDNDGQMFAVSMPDDLWQLVSTGDTLLFEYSGVRPYEPPVEEDTEDEGDGEDAD